MWNLEQRQIDIEIDYSDCNICNSHIKIMIKRFVKSTSF